MTATDDLIQSFFGQYHKLSGNKIYELFYVWYQAIYSLKNKNYS